MKKITVYASIVLISLLSACSSQRMVQRDPVAINAYVWAMPVSENLNFRNLLPENVIMILAWDATSKPKYVLISKAEFEQLVNFFANAKQTNNLYGQNRFIGVELSIAEIEGLSFLTDQQLRNMSTGDQKRLSQALNPYKKYTLMSQNLKCLIGYREGGKYYPDFSDYTYKDPGEPAGATGAIKKNDVNPFFLKKQQ